tara:strand:+ start:952 stop:1230 length:279 start_codon:yes stop_codon:yes gene_type:complete
MLKKDNIAQQNNLRWSPFLVYVDNKNYSPGFRDDSKPFEDYEKGIHISMPTTLPVVEGSKFEFNGRKMKALTVRKCEDFEDHFYVFCRQDND